MLQTDQVIVQPALLIFHALLFIKLAGAVGFEPTIHDTKNRCLTTWLRPIRTILLKSRFDKKPSLSFSLQEKLTHK